MLAFEIFKADKHFANLLYLIDLSIAFSFHFRLLRNFHIDIPYELGQNPRGYKSLMISGIYFPQKFFPMQQE